MGHTATGRRQPREHTKDKALNWQLTSLPSREQPTTGGAALRDDTVRDLALVQG